MTQSKPRSRKRNSGMGAIKTLIVSLGLALIFGFWGLFARQTNPAEKVEALPTTTEILLDPDQTRAVMIELPPLPTLIPPLDPNTGVQTVQTEPAVVIQPQVQPNTTIFLGGAKPNPGGGSNDSSFNPGSVTVTRSS